MSRGERVCAGPCAAQSIAPATVSTVAKKAEFIRVAALHRGSSRKTPFMPGSGYSTLTNPGSGSPRRCGW